MIYVALGLIAAVVVGEGLVIVGFLFAADATHHDPTTVDLEDA